MAEQARERSRSTRGKKREEEPQGDGNNGRDAEVARDEGELASYLAERIKPGLNRGAIPLLARSIARDFS